MAKIKEEKERKPRTIKKPYQKHKTEKVITIKHYLNKNLKPQKDTDKYPLYIQISLNNKTGLIKSTCYDFGGSESRVIPLNNTYYLNDEDFATSKQIAEHIKKELIMIDFAILIVKPFEQKEFQIKDLVNTFRDLDRSFLFYLDRLIKRVLKFWLSEGIIDNRIIFNECHYLNLDIDWERQPFNIIATKCQIREPAIMHEFAQLFSTLFFWNIFVKRSDKYSEDDIMLLYKIKTFDISKNWRSNILEPFYPEFDQNLIFDDIDTAHKLLDSYLQKYGSEQKVNNLFNDSPFGLMQYIATNQETKINTKISIS
jgi:hypothetical protein